MKRYSLRVYPLFYSLLLILSFFADVSAQENPLANGSWAKFEIPREGLYRLLYEDLQGAGISTDAGFTILSLPGGTLPQSNSADYPDFLTELPVAIYDGNDGSFDPGDYLVFFAGGAVTNNPAGGYDNTPYDVSNYVFVGAGESTMEIVRRTEITTPGTEIRSYSAVQSYEQTLNNLLSSGRNWYGERFDNGQSLSFSFQFEDPLPSGTVRLHSKVMAQSFSPATFVLEVNGTAVGEQRIDPVPDFQNPPTNNPFRFAVKGREREDIFEFAGGEEQLTVSYSYQGSGSGRSVGYLDYIWLEVESRMSFSGDQILLQSAEISSPIAQTLFIDNMKDENAVWDISNSLQPRVVADFVLDGDQFQFNHFGSPQARYVAFNPMALPRPIALSTRSYEDILSGNPDLLIVAHEQFREAANRLAAFRASVDGLSVAVVSIEDVYDLMASGRQDPTAIRNISRWFYRKGGLKYLLLFGKGSFDYQEVVPFFSNYVPTYQSRNSLDPLDTYASDDYFGFMEEDEGEWLEEQGGNHTLDIGVGRLPVTTAAEADGVVNKLIAYTDNTEMLGAWRSKLLFVADDEDFNLHHRQSDQLAIMVDSTEKFFRNTRLFLGSFPQESSGGGSASPQATETLDREIRQGALILNYTGHGNENNWTQERILTRAMIPGWKNLKNLPLFVTATCEFGRHDDPRQISGGELIVTQPDGGGIGILSTGRPVFASSNFRLNEAFYTSVFEKTDGQYGRLGDVMRLTKNRSVDKATDVNKVGNRNFTLLGDPSLLLAYPKEQVVISEITVNGIPGDTLKAGDKVRIQGFVQNNPGFSGIAEISVRDKPVNVQTIDAPVYTYNERINPVFQGSASVTDGSFSFEFIVPLNISNREGNGRIYIYAAEEAVNSDALGGSADVVLGGSFTGDIVDNTGPDIELFFGDSTNMSRRDIPTNTLLYVYLGDDSGINTSGFGVGNSLTAVLDDSASFVLNDFYKASPNTFQEGWAVFPLNNLAPGNHRVTITARDIFNNSSSLTVTFEVGDPGSLVISKLRNYPNPVRGNTTFTFSHNRPGDDLDIVLSIMDTRGSVIVEIPIFVESSRTTVTLPVWDSIPQSTFLSEGIYIYGIQVRSRLDGAMDRKYEKMMLLIEN